MDKDEQDGDENEDENELGRGGTRVSTEAAIVLRVKR